MVRTLTSTPPYRNHHLSNHNYKFFQNITEQLLHKQSAAGQRETHYEQEAWARKEREEQQFKAQLDMEKARLEQNRTLADERVAWEEAKEKDRARQDSHNNCIMARQRLPHFPFQEV